MDILGLIDKRASLDGTPEYNLKDAVYENLSMEQIEIFELGLSMALNAVMSFVPGGAILTAMDQMSDWTSKLEIAQQSLDYERLGKDKNNYAFVMKPAETTEEQSKIIMEGLRTRMSMETVQKTLKDTFGTDYKMSPNEAFPLTPLISEITLVTGDAEGKGIFTLVNSLYAEFGATILLRQFYKLVKNLDVTDAEELKAVTDAWSTIRGVAEEVASLEEYGIKKTVDAIVADSTIGDLSSTGNSGDGQSGVAQTAALFGVGLLIAFGFLACCVAYACCGGDDENGADDYDDD